MAECRACRRVAGFAQRHPLFEHEQGSNGSARFRRYNLLTSIEIKPTDENAPYLCNQCEAALLDFENFRNMCIESDKIIRSVQTNHEPPVECVVKTEPEENHPPSAGDDDIEYDESADNHDDSISDFNSAEENIKSQAITRRKRTATQKPASSKSRTNSQHTSKTAAAKKPATTTTRFECDMCGQTFLKKHRIEAHLRNHVGLKPFCCAACPSTFRKYSSLRMHEKRKHPALATGNRTNANRRYPCSIAGCQKTYMESSSLRTHVKRFHLGEKPEMRLVCETCGAAFYSGWALNEHMYRHRDPSTYPYVCEMCPKRFANKHTFHMHIIRHKNIRNYQCTQCDTRTVTKAELEVHMAYHNKELTVACELCPNKFTTQNGLRRHKIRVHEGRKPYGCTYCGLCFGSKATMLNHTMRHTGEKPHACQVCDRRFLQLVTLKTHMKVHAKVEANNGARSSSNVSI